MSEETPGTGEPQLPVSSEMSQQVSEELNKYAVENETPIMYWEHDIRGERMRQVTDPEGNMKIVWELKGKMIMNEQGIQWFISFLRPATDKDTKLSNFSEIRVNQICRRQGHVLRDKMLLSVKVFGIDESDLDYVFWSTMRTFETAMRRAIEGSEREGWNKTIATLQRFGMGQRKERERGLGNLFSILGGKKQNG